MSKNNHKNEPYINSGIGPSVDNLINVLIEKICSKNFKDNIKNKVLQPSINVAYSKMKPYLYFGGLLYLLLVILQLFIIYLLFNVKNSTLNLGLKRRN